MTSSRFACGQADVSTCPAPLCRGRPGRLDQCLIDGTLRQGREFEALRYSRSILMIEILDQTACSGLRTDTGQGKCWIMWSASHF